MGYEDYHHSSAVLGESFYNSLVVCNDVRLEDEHWKHTVPTKNELLRRKAFGQQDIDHSFSQEAAFETTLLHVLTSGYLDPTDTIHVCETHPLVMHLATAKVTHSNYDFTWLREYNLTWEQQPHIDTDKMTAMTACLLHFNLDSSLLMRYLGNNYTGAYRQVNDIVTRLRALHIDEELISKYTRVMLTGCPNRFVAETTRENALLHWRHRNGPTIDKKLKQVMKTMNKEDKNNFVISLPHWVARFMPHLFFTPQHILEKPGKKDRQIFDASKRYTPWSTPINMMTSTPAGSEEDCLFGSVREEILHRLYNCRISFPNTDLIIHANDVKSAFRQIKLHPDIMGAFSFIIADTLFLSCGLPFGTDFSPANWEVVRQLLERTAEALFDDDSLVDKHRKYLDWLQFDRALGKLTKVQFTRAVADEFNTGVTDATGQPHPTPHHYYVDDGVYVETHNKARIERAAAASIESIFLLLGHSDLSRRQDPVSFDKLVEMIVSYVNKVLGHVIDTRRLTIATPPEFETEILKSLDTTWGPHRKQFFVGEVAELAGKLGHMCIAAPWLKFLMSHLYSSMAYALKMNQWDLIKTSRSFREALKQLRTEDTHNHRDASRVTTFYQAETARTVHKHKKHYRINKTMRRELNLIRTILRDDSISRKCPIAHLIPKAHSAESYSDSSLHAAGGYCSELKFWWYIEWPPEVQRRTLKFVKNNKSGDLIDINVLEYAAILINFLAASHCLRAMDLLALDPHPVLLLRGDNSASESWAKKGSKHSPMGRALGRLQCALMLDNPIGLRLRHISTGDNVVADDISRVDHESNFPHAFLTLCQEHPALIGCRRFCPSSELTSCVMDTILSAECRDPVELSRLLLTAPGKITI